MDFRFLDNNPVVAGGFVLMVLGGLLYSLKRLPGRIYDLIERFFIIRMEILDEDESYQWMQVWLAERLRRALAISVVTRRKKRADCGQDEQAHDDKPTIHFVPAVGTYFFWYKGRFLSLSRHRDEKKQIPALVSGFSGDGQSALRDKESFTLRIFSRNKDLARQLIMECRDYAMPDDGKLDIRIPAYGQWVLGTRSKARPLASVILHGNQAEVLLADIRKFLGSYDWYHQTGVPYRRGYLLYGPPGNGKSSVVKAVAGELKLGIYLMMLSDPDIKDNRIGNLLARVAEKSIVLLEDVDCAFTMRKRASGKENGLTFSGLLNAIDGVASAEGRIIVMTTNHIERLDPALIRPGRADLKLLLDNASLEQARRLFEQFFPQHRHLANDFAGRIEDRKHTMAALQNYLMLHRDDPEGALHKAPALQSLQVGPPVPSIASATIPSSKPCRTAWAR
jgi:chaperone BCS1